ncbi:MAG: methyl-accepting chemotaxis protein [Planctomycetaceae bacterium]|jgi:methyl-accepting chemotaxis protein|nr:methyl-accepting chemotaxis protein [Planctomycetaceae bacterium]
MKNTGLSKSVVIFTAAALLLLISVVIHLERRSAPSPPVSFDDVTKENAAAANGILKELSAQKTAADAKLKTQNDYVVQETLQTLTNRLKAEFDAYVNITQHLSLTSATEKLSLDRKARKAALDTVPIRISSGTQYIAVANRFSRFKRQNSAAVETDDNAVEECPEFLEVAELPPPLLKTAVLVTPSSMPQYRIAASGNVTEKPAKPVEPVEPAEQKPVEAKTEPVKVEAKKEEPKKTEPVKVEAKKEEPKKTEPVKIEAKKEEPKKTETVKVETKKEEPKKPETVKVEAKKEEPKKTEPVKVETKKEEPKKTEAVKVEAKKEEPKKSEAVKVEAKKDDPKKSEAVKVEAKKEEPKKTETVKVETKKEEPKKTEAVTEPVSEPAPQKPTKEETESRDFLKDLTFKTVQGNENINSAWLCWEPNAFNVTTTDRFSASSTRGSSGIAAGEVTKPDTMPEYIQAVKNGRTVISEPVRKNGTAVMTFAAPIQYRDKTHGVCAAEIKTDSFASCMRQIIAFNPLLRDGAKAYLISPKGIIAASNDKTVSAGTPFSGHSHTMKLFESKFYAAGENWTLKVYIPEETLAAPFKESQNGYEKNVQKIEAAQAALSGHLSKTQSDILNAAKAQAKSAKNVHYIAALFAAVLIFVTAYYWQRSLTQQKEQCFALQQQIIDLIASPVLVIDTESEVQFQNKAAADKKTNPLKTGLDGLERKPLAVIPQTFGKERYEVRAKRLTNRKQKTIGMVQVFNDITFQSETVQQLKIIGQTIQQAHQEVSGIVTAAAALQNDISLSADKLGDMSSKIVRTSELTESNGKNASEASQYTKDAVQAASKGQKQMQDMVSSMTNICKMSEQMKKVIKTIDEIAFQTNLLALNAAVEAARAGQHGKGFAVVAEEVRNLASRSAKAAKETAELIESSNKQILGGAGIANQTAEALNEITKLINGATELVSQIAETTAEQSSNVKDITSAITDVDRLTQQNSATASEAASASNQLATVMAGLRETSQNK